MSSKHLERRRSGILEQRLLITKLIRELCRLVITTREDLLLIYNLRHGNMVPQETLDLTLSGKMIDIILLFSVTLIDTITSTSPNKNTEIFSEVLLDKEKKKKDNTIS